MRVNLLYVTSVVPRIERSFFFSLSLFKFLFIYCSLVKKSIANANTSSGCCDKARSTNLFMSERSSGWPRRYFSFSTRRCFYNTHTHIHTYMWIIQDFSKTMASMWKAVHSNRVCVVHISSFISILWSMHSNSPIHRLCINHIRAYLSYSTHSIKPKQSTFSEQSMCAHTFWLSRCSCSSWVNLGLKADKLTSMMTEP